jgi:hypothetical protein
MELKNVTSIDENILASNVDYTIFHIFPKICENWIKKWCLSALKTKTFKFLYHTNRLWMNQSFLCSCKCGFLLQVTILKKLKIESDFFLLLGNGCTKSLDLGLEQQNLFS